jgi:hypothetical protein
MVAKEAVEMVEAKTLESSNLATAGTETGSPSSTEPDTPVLFPEVTQVRPCTFLACKNNHQWTPMLALAKCGHGTSQGWRGCGCPILAVKMVCCPVCNEPSDKLVLRMDHTPPVPFPVPVCIPGSGTTAEVLVIQIPLRAAIVTEEANDKERLEKEQNGKGIQE